MATEQDLLRLLPGLRELQDTYAQPITDTSRQAPAVALHSLRDAAANAPAVYRDYLDEAIDCYESGAYRGAVLMVWSATVEHLYSVIEGYSCGIKLMESENVRRFGNSANYKRIRRKNDLLHLNDGNFLQLCEDAGLFNKSAKTVLTERLGLRNRCGHPSGYTVGREETVVFVESLILNFLSNKMLHWA